MAEVYRPLEIQRQAHRALLIAKYKRALLYWSRRTGKTRWSLEQLKLSCMLFQGPHHIVFKEYQQAETVAWNQYLHTIPKELIKSTDKSTLTVTFNYLTGDIRFPDPIGVIHVEADTSKPPASIRLLGSDKADSHRGGESYGMIFDEYQDQDSYGWDYVYKYFLATTDGWACFMGTAKDEDRWNEMLDKAQNLDNWYYSKATWRENPLIKPEWIEQERIEAELEHRLGPFLQETELIPFSQQGAVYPMFNKEIHVVKPTEIPDEGTDYIAMDFGFAEGHPMAACFVRIARDDIWYQWDEIHGSGIQLDDAIAEIRMKMGDRLLTGIIADSARPDLIEYMQSKGLPVIPSPKKQNSVASGIQLFAKRLRPKIQVMGIPKPNFYISNTCKKTIYDFTHYRYKEVKENRHPMENPEKRFDDSCFVAGTLIDTPDGPRPIESLKSGDYATTPFGKSKVISARSTGVRNVVDYGIFTATPNHKIITNDGVVRVDAMRYDSLIWVNEQKKLSEFTLTEYLIGGILSPLNVVTNYIFNGLLTRNLEAKLGFSTETFGNSITGQFLKECASTTNMALTTTALKHLSLLLTSNMPRATSGEKPLLKSILSALDRLQQTGMVVRKDCSGIVSTESELGKTENFLQPSALFVEEITKHLSQLVVSTAIQTVKPRPSGVEEVYNLATEDGMYFANTVLVSNCDALRYLELFFKYGTKDLNKTIPKTVAFNKYGLL